MKKLLYISVLVIISIPGFLGITCLYEESPMHGDISKNELYLPQDFCWDIWFSGLYQYEIERSASAGTGARGILARIVNQINFFILRTNGNKHVVVGKNNYLYEKGYITAYTGKNFCGEYFISRSVAEFRKLQKLLKEKYNTDLILVFEPGKAGTFPENIPEYEKLYSAGNNNYSEFIKQCNQQDLQALDLQNYFLMLKDSSDYPLFSPYGVHWTTYGMYLATDTILAYIRNKTGRNVADINITDLQITDTTKDVDFDLEKTMNLYSDLPHVNFAFPVIRWDTAGKERPKVLTIADSYYWSLYNNKVPEMAFSNKEYWYYYKTIYPYVWLDNPKWIKDIDREAVYLDQDIILFMITEMNLHRAFWGFTDELLDQFDTTRIKDPLFETMKYILNDELFYPIIIEKTSEWSCSFELALNKMSSFIINLREHPESKQAKDFWSAYRKLKRIKGLVY